MKLNLFQVFSYDYWRVLVKYYKEIVVSNNGVKKGLKRELKDQTQSNIVKMKKNLDMGLSKEISFIFDGEYTHQYVYSHQYVY